MVETTEPSRSESTSADENRLLLAGDVMLGRGIDQVLPYPGDPTLHETWRGVTSATAFVQAARQKNGPVPERRAATYVWGDVLAAVEAFAPDVSVINLETAITARGEPWPGKRIHYRMNPRNIEVLRCAGVDVCALANNHVMDWGVPGLEDTIETLRQAGIAASGAGRNRAEAAAPAIVSIGTKSRVLVFSIAMSTAGVPMAWMAQPNAPGINLLDFSEFTHKFLRNRIAAARQTGDIVVLSIHWGENFVKGIEPSHRTFAHRLIDEAGVDLVHGHSSHHACGIELHHGKPILYGCGDLITDYEGVAWPAEREALLPRLGPIYGVRFSSRDGRFLGLEMRVFRMHRMQAIRADAVEVGWLAGNLRHACAPLGTTVIEDGGALRLLPV